MRAHEKTSTYRVVACCARIAIEPYSNRNWNTEYKPHHSSFSTPNGMEIFLKGPTNGASNARGMKNHDFRPIFRFVSELMQDRAIVTMEGG